jgi:tetratricopeptide (TPR) repeat protein/Ser/Thr protein kinase RdoA (MazF antagonist)
MSACLSEERVVELLRGELDEAVASEALSHLDGCDSCRVLVAAASSLLLDLTEASPDERPASARFQRGDRIGRYLVLDLVGEGAMGSVYAVYDPELDRRVALKLLRPALHETEERPELPSRLVREAKAMARLSHPNVIAVHEVGKHEARVFLAMDFIDGETLRHWLRREPRSWRDVLAAFVQAGRGMAAAHEAGVIHRDFKPDNVLVDGTGRVLVSDFGLARTIGEMRDPSAADEHPSAPTPLASLTQSGMVVGTPAYMAPEQRTGHPPSPRADQYSFCVALYEALYGEHPFAPGRAPAKGSGRKALRIRDTPKGTRVPAWLRRVVARGLERDPQARYASMDELLAALSREPRKKRIAALVGTLAAAAVAGSWSIVHESARRDVELCANAAQELVGVWDADRKPVVRAAFLSTGKPFASSASESTERLLDSYASAWTSAHLEACEATRKKGYQSEELLDRRMECLRDHRQELAALVDVFAQADGKVVEKAMNAASALPRIESCSAKVVLNRRVERPVKEIEQRVATVRASLAKARALWNAGKVRSSREIAEPAVRTARSLGFPPLEAEALFVLAREHPKQRELYEEALHAATAGRHDEMAARVLLGLTYVAARDSRFEDALNLARNAEAVLRRLPEAADLTATLTYYRGVILHYQGEFSKARSYYEDAIALAEKLGGPGQQRLVTILSALGFASHMVGRHEEARAHYQRALSVYEKTLGPDTPGFDTALSNLGNLEEELGHYEAALRLYERSLAIAERTYGPEHRNVASHLSTTGMILVEKGEYDKALKLSERALAIAKKITASGPLLVAPTLTWMADALLDLGRAEEARSHLEKALVIREKALGPSHTDVADTLTGLAIARARLGQMKEAIRLGRRAVEIAEAKGRPRQLGIALDSLGVALLADRRFQDALPVFTRAVVVVEKALPPDHPELASLLVGQGETLVALGRTSESVPPLERALRILEPRGGNAMRLARARFALARALFATKGDAARVGTLAEKARRGFTRPSPQRAAQVADWMAHQAKSR